MHTHPLHTHTHTHTHTLFSTHSLLTTIIPAGVPWKQWAVSYNHPHHTHSLFCKHFHRNSKNNFTRKGFQLYDKISTFHPYPPSHVHKPRPPAPPTSVVVRELLQILLLLGGGHLIQVGDSGGVRWVVGADQHLGDVPRLVEGLAVDGLVTLNYGRQVNQLWWCVCGCGCMRVSRGKGRR